MQNSASKPNNKAKMANYTLKMEQAKEGTLEQCIVEVTQASKKEILNSMTGMLKPVLD